MSIQSRTLPLLIRREFWEHRAFLFAPAIVAAIMLLGALFGTNDLHVSNGVPDPDWLQHSDTIVAVVLSGLAAPFGIVMCIVVVFYLLDSLYADRKDRSILFWKSLPLSDVETVTAKVLTAVLVVPLLTLVAVFLTNLLVAFILSVRLSGVEQLDVWAAVWQPKIWLQVHGLMLYGVFVTALWYLPITAWLMLASAWARRAVLLWAALPPILAMILEEILFDTANVATLLRDRLVGWMQFDGEAMARNAIEIDGDRVAFPQQITDFIDPAAYFSSPGLWGGIVVAALLFWATLVIRRRRNDV
jgi:ABC-2 type transport system permease protein